MFRPSRTSDSTWREATSFGYPYHYYTRHAMGVISSGHSRTDGHSRTIAHRSIFEFRKPPAMAMKLTFRSQAAFRVGLDVSGSLQGGTLSRGVARLRQKLAAAPEPRSPRSATKRMLPSKANVLEPRAPAGSRAARPWRDLSGPLPARVPGCQVQRVAGYRSS